MLAPNAHLSQVAANARVLTPLVSGSDSGQTAQTTSPVNLSPLASIPVSDQAAVTEAFAKSRHVQHSWERMSTKVRAEIMLRFHDLLFKDRETGLDIIQAETGKARLHAVEELLAVALVARHYARTADKLLRPKRHAGPMPLLSPALEVRHPRGVIGVIAPWNYPLVLSIGDALAALMAGNGAVLKPDSQTPLTALWAINLLYEAGLPEDLVGVVYGSGAVLGPVIVGEADYLMFTGSTAVGRQVAAQCGERLISCSMELGGKNAMIICGDANVKRAAEIAVRACFTNAGQLCISIERIYVDRRIARDFLDEFVDRTSKLRVSAALGWGADMGSLISGRQLDVVNSHVTDAVGKGATVLAGGRPRPDGGPLCYEPTILTGVTPEMTCYAEETFGPVVSVYPVDGDEEAIELSNDTDYGLNGSVITGSPRRGREIARRLRVGSVNINEGYATSFATTSAPMGGFGVSGIGRRHGSEGLLKYTEAQTISTQRLMGWGVPPLLNDRIWSETLVAFVRGLKLMGKK
ncbi:MAG: succinic semialdehyde dehydrogenase [Candidatus Nanopelagicales bacterium]|nr:succinic semialdehyde dehydrogenase [Candidatus Nanopelagicales bacterium]